MMMMMMVVVMMMVMMMVVTRNEDDKDSMTYAAEAGAKHVPAKNASWLCMSML